MGERDERVTTTLRCLPIEAHILRETAARMGRPMGKLVALAITRYDESLRLQAERALLQAWGGR
jgi:hypothetical protein